jgi:hypothetical protein
MAIDTLFSDNLGDMTFPRVVSSPDDSLLALRSASRERKPHAEVTPKPQPAQTGAAAGSCPIHLVASKEAS